MFTCKNKKIQINAMKRLEKPHKLMPSQWIIFNETGIFYIKGDGPNANKLTVKVQTGNSEKGPSENRK